MEAGSARCFAAGFQNERGPQAKVCVQPLEAGKGQETDSPLELQKKHGLADSFILACVRFSTTEP